MARPESIQWYYRRWLGDQRILGMDWDARAMHFHLLMMSIQEEPPGSIPDDMALIRRWLGSPSEDTWRRVRPQVLSAWTLRTDRWFNQGMVETFERKARYSDRYENGTKTVRKSTENQVNSNSNSSLVLNERKESRRTEDQELDSALSELPPESDELIESIALLHPANWRQKGKIAQVPHAQAIAIIAAISRDSKELVEQGTEKYGAAVSRWPLGERQFVVNPVRFWNESHYLKDPREWERTNGRRNEVSKDKQRFINNLRAVGLVEEAEAVAGAGMSGGGQGVDAGAGAVIRGDPAGLLSD